MSRVQAQPWEVDVVGLWPTLPKAGLPGWGAVIPLYFIPLVNLFVFAYIAGAVANAFGQRSIFAFFVLFLVPPLGFLMLGYGSCRYQFRRFDAVG